MLEAVEQPAAGGTTRGVVKVDVLVPRGHEEPEGRGRELDGGDGVGGGVRELVLGWKAGCQFLRIPPLCHGIVL